MKKIFLTAPIFFLILLGAGCSATVSGPAADQGMTRHGGSPATTPAMMTTGAVEADSRVALENKNSFQPGPIIFAFKLYGKNGKELTDNDLKIEHEKKMHFILVRDDMTQFQHIHPAYKDGKWSVSTRISEVGLYQLYVDIAPQNEGAVILRVPVLIGGATGPALTPTPTADNSAETNGVRAVLAFSSVPLTANRETALTFTLTQNSKPVAKVDPYLGAFGHVVLLKHDSPNDFFHTHPVTETAPPNGQVKFAATFPTAGRYTLYAQFNINGKIETFPVTVDVNAQGRKTNPSAGSAVMQQNIQ